MSKSKNPKRQKLRNNEYYDFQKVQDDLYAKSQNGYIFKDLMSKITSEANILLAYRNIKKNTGSQTKGTDGKTIASLAKLEPKDNNGKNAVRLYNSYVLGVHNYFNCATNCNIDLAKIAFITRATLKNRLHLRRKKANEKIPKYMDKSYGKSKQIRYVYDTPMLPIGYIQHQKQMNFSQKSLYIANDREQIHKNQKAVDISALRYLMENPIQGQSVEYNDNRISLFVGQYGNCYVTPLCQESCPNL